MDEIDDLPLVFDGDSNSPSQEESLIGALVDALENAQQRLKKLEKLMVAVDRQAKQAPDSISISLRYALNQCRKKD